MTSDIEKAELRNKFFVNIGEELAMKFPTDATENHLEHIHRITQTLDCMSPDILNLELYLTLITK